MQEDSAEPDFEPSALEAEIIDAIRRGQAAAVQDRLAQGMDLHFRAGHSGETPLHIAAAYNRGEIVRILVTAGADIDRRDRQGQSPLFYAADKGGIEALGTLLELRADPNHAAYSGRTALFSAALRGRDDLIAALLSQGADPNVTADGSSALFYATNRGHFNAVRTLVQGGARIDIVNAQGETAMKMARRLKRDVDEAGMLAAFLEAAAFERDAREGLRAPVTPLRVLRLKPRS
jgi:ankyrin repeat protein